MTDTTGAIRHQIVTQAPGVDGGGITAAEKAQLIQDVEAVAGLGDAVARVDPGVPGLPYQILQHGASGPEWKSKSVYDIRDLVSDTTGTTDMYAELQAALNNLPPGSTVVAPQGTKVRLSQQTEIKVPGTTLLGPGEFTFPDAHVGWTPLKGAIWGHADNVTVDGIKVTNPNGLAQGSAIKIMGNNGVVMNTQVDNWGTGITFDWREGNWSGFICYGNRVTNNRGNGVENANDGIYVRGSDSIVVNNYVEAKAGQDPRCGIVIQGKHEGMTQTKYSFGTEVTATNHIIANNIIVGPFRRAIHSELTSHFVIANNTMYGMTYWGIISWSDKGAGLITGNTIRWTYDGSGPAPGPGLAIPDDGTPTLCAGIYVYLSKAVRVSNNTIIVHHASIEYGILVRGHWSIAGRLYGVTVEGNSLECIPNDVNVMGIAGNSLNGDIIKISNNTIRGGFRHSIVAYILPGSAKSTVIIGGNDIVRANNIYKGIMTVGVHTAIIYDNLIVNAGTCVHINGGTLAVVKHNTFMDSVAGVWAQSVTEAYVPNNTIINLSGTKITGATSTTAYGPA